MRPVEDELLRQLVAIPSISGQEEPLARFLEEMVRGWGLDVRRDSTAVKVALELGPGGRTLAFASHLDVVPPGSGWTRDPFTPVVEGERLYGRGSGDAKAAVAAMLCAAWDLAHHRPSAPPAGRLLVILGYAEETRDTSMP